MARSPKSPKIFSTLPFLVKNALPSEIDGLSAAAAKAAAAFMDQLVATHRTGKPAIAMEPLASGDHWRLGLVNDDQPFLVDSVSTELTARGIALHRVLHPVIKLEGGARLSLIYIELSAPEDAAAVLAGLRHVLAMVAHAVADWPALKSALRVDTAAMTSKEGAELLHWFGADRFTMLGHAIAKRSGVMEAPLGIAREYGVRLLSAAAIKNAIAWFEAEGAPLLTLKSNLYSPVHRRVPLELVLVPRFTKGKLTALSIHAGLWTSAALRTAPEETPMLRARLGRLQEKFGFDPQGHAGKALTHALTALPHDALVSMDDVSLEHLAVTVMSVTDRPRPVLALTNSPLGRHLDGFVWLPRDELTTQRRLAIGAKLEEAASAPLLSWAISLDDSGIALLRFTLDIRDGAAVPDGLALNCWLEELVRGWESSVASALGKNAGLARDYAAAFPDSYRTSDGAVQAAEDIRALHGLCTEAPFAARLFERAGALHLKLYADHVVDLSAAVPALENFGFRVMGENPVALDGKAAVIHDFTLALALADQQAALLATPGRVEAAFAGVIAGAVENDRFNALMVSVGLEAQHVMLFRALFRYLRQTGMAYGLLTVVDALTKAPAITRALVMLFAARHDPEARKGAEGRSTAALSAIDEGLRGITALDDDRILRLIRAIITSTLRTNFFAPAAAEALAFKLDSATIPGLPDPKPWREIFVYAPRVEGIHLRAGPVARGGLRWSDRRDDFRTEVLGLMKAQRVKNAVIVPTGAKGGFYPKQLPDSANRDAWAAEGKESYKIFIRALLSVTDNIVGGTVVHPAGVVVHDGEDPYFVVAADKGTATFSDTANAIALEHGFWLGDAFASGGSKGYDHKAMGITAKGGWVSVTRHFAEMGVDVQADPVRVAGCGDMSGDVFGNGMLLSKSIKLVAAFDHRHIFFDPHPDAVKSWEERARLFALPRSSWADYDAKLISAGGGIFPRSAKTIRLTQEIKALLDVQGDEMEPSQMISALLRAPVDLLWFGGIGTYLKSSAERNSEVGDRANDALRVNGADVRAKVIAEGANLGLTQAARIEFALRGGRVNTDFIDNSAGVDCSDNEVNIKIAFNAAMASGQMTESQRVKMLVRMTDDVSALVLEDNRLQTLALSIAEREGATGLPALVRLIERLEATGKLDRAVEGIASNDALSRRAAEGKGLTRPELAIIMATAKLWMQDALEHSGLGNDPAAEHCLFNAFPTEMQKTYEDVICTHRLRGEIIATKLANRIINRMGLIHPFELAEEEGCLLDDVAEAFLIAQAVYDLPALWKAVDVTPMPEAARLLLFDQIAIEIRAHMADILRNAVDNRSNDKAIAAYQPCVTRLSQELDALLPPETRRQMQAYHDRLVVAQVPDALAAKVVRLASLDGAIGLAALATAQKVDVVIVTRAFAALGEALGLDWAQGTAMSLDPVDPWERLLAAGVARDFQSMRLQFLASRGGRKPVEFVSAWLKANSARVGTFRSIVTSARAAPPTPAMLAQIAGQARALLAKGVDR